MEAHYAVPPVWSDTPSSEPPLEKLKMVGTSMKEPECPDEWCATAETVKWTGVRASFGQVLTTGHKQYPLDLPTAHDEL